MHRTLRLPSLLGSLASSFLAWGALSGAALASGGVSAAEATPPRLAALPGALEGQADALPSALALRGLPEARVLLLLGAPRVGPAADGRRVEPVLAEWVRLNAFGALRVELGEVDAPLFAQLWSPPGAGALSPVGSWSELVVTFPVGGQLNSTAGPGDLVVTEFMKDPSAVSDNHGEWIEVRNMLPWRLDIAGVVLSDTSGASFVFDNGGAPLYLRPDEFFVIGADADPTTNGGVVVDHEWTGFSLKNSSDEIFLHDRFGVLMDAVVYDDGVLWPDSSGMSISLEPTSTSAALNDDPALWCHSSTVMGAGPDTGTPGASNDLCP